MRFTLRQIRYFVAAAKTSSIVRASEQIHISQASISAAISCLEADYGIQLFVRHHAQGLSLTRQGQHFLSEAKALLLQAGEVEATALELASKVGGLLELGCLSTLFPLLVPELVHALRARHEGAGVHALAGHQDELMEKLRRGEIAMALTYDLDLPPDLEFIGLARLPPYAFVAMDHPLARRRTVSLEELVAEPYLLLNMPTSRDYFLALFRQSGLSPRIGGRFEHLDVIRSLVARGEGFSLANAQAQPRLARRLSARLFAAFRQPARPIAGARDGTGTAADPDHKGVRGALSRADPRRPYPGHERVHQDSGVTVTWPSCSQCLGGYVALVRFLRTSGRNHTRYAAACDSGAVRAMCRIIGLIQIFWILGTLAALPPAAFGQPACQPKLGHPPLVRAGTLMTAINPTVAPIQYIDENGHLAGLDVEFGNMIARASA